MADQDVIANRYGLKNGRVFATWLRSLNYLPRLWNRNIVDQPKLPPAAELSAFAEFHNEAHRLARPSLLLCIAQHLMQHINPASTWGARLKDLLQNGFPDLTHLGLDLGSFGVYPGWENRNW